MVTMTPPLPALDRSRIMCFFVVSYVFECKLIFELCVFALG